MLGSKNLSPDKENYIRLKAVIQKVVSVFQHPWFIEIDKNAVPVFNEQLPDFWKKTEQIEY